MELTIHLTTQEYTALSLEVLTTTELLLRVVLLATSLEIFLITPAIILLIHLPQTGRRRTVPAAQVAQAVLLPVAVVHLQGDFNFYESQKRL